MTPEQYADEMKRRNRRVRLYGNAVVAIFFVLAIMGGTYLVCIGSRCREVRATDTDGKPVMLKVCGGRAWVSE